MASMIVPCEPLSARSKETIACLRLYATLTCLFHDVDATVCGHTCAKKGGKSALYGTVESYCKNALAWLKVVEAIPSSDPDIDALVGLDVKMVCRGSFYVLVGHGYRLLTALSDRNLEFLEQETLSYGDKAIEVSPEIDKRSRWAGFWLVQNFTVAQSFRLTTDEWMRKDRQPNGMIQSWKFKDWYSILVPKPVEWGEV
jgi:hypothetical protein